MGRINFAQGEFAMFVAFICWALVQAAQLPFAMAVVISAPRLASAPSASNA